MYSIYRIVNFRNGKVYVGQTNHFRRRKTDHLKALRAGNHTNQHLQRAYNKYGGSAFFFEVIEKNLELTNVYEREKYWIKHFNAFKDGYNCTPGGEGKTGGTKCIWNGIEYDSIAAAARSVGIDPSSMKSRLDKGYVCDEQVPIKGMYFAKPFTWKGIEYPSMQAASRATGHHETYFTQVIALGRAGENPHPNAIPCVWLGVEYQSIHEAARAEGVTMATMKRWLKKGFKSRADVKDRWGNPIYE